ncbi:MULTISPECIES: class I SAM-dependent methyltransferase [Methanobacterium]|uniref:Class I SAM-dependent methyltransferase n=1 Tax=Methanobacterium veterum TaxID=408577 RepID=A0A9E5A6P7_9EURY|nr:MULTISPECIES: class I SAM-dependent methyltransferase [Methanobacterium]MCZ3367520.1 class I SAM-dependent methyltransferase [Methanobacterium veterum]MCZ3373332.1 class I SAM-dependent methyltransferase [Methanobacterium veterum]
MNSKFPYCDLCQSKEVEFLFSNEDRMFPEMEGSFNLLKCKECGLIFVYPQPSFNILTNHYPDNYSVFDEGKIKHFRKVFTLIEMLYQYCNVRSDQSIFFRLINLLLVPFSPMFRTISLVENGNFLDVGCGIGYFPLVMKYLGMNAYGVEPGKIDRELSEQYNLDITTGTLLEAKYNDNFFDLITLNHVLEHVDNPSEIMKELHRILKPNGFLVIATPISDSLAFKIFGKYWAQLDSPRHLFLFSTSVLKKYSEKYGFDIIKIRYNSTPSFQFISSIIYFLEDKRKKRCNRSLVQNPLLNLFFLPLTLVLNLIKRGDQCEFVMVKTEI